MLIKNINQTFCYLIFLILIVSEFYLFYKSACSFQTEIYVRKVNILTDSPGVIRLLPGVGAKKLEEILELRKTEKSSTKILEQIGLSKRFPENEKYLQEE